MNQAECEKCQGKGETHGLECIVRRIIFERDFKERTRPQVTRREAIEAAVLALKNYQDGIIAKSMTCKVIPFKKGKKMSAEKQTAIPPTGMDLEKLKEPFEEKEIEFRLSQCGENKNGIWAKCLAYITSRAIMDRLDSVCGPGNWKVSYEFIGEKGVICNLSILVDGQWITKQDGAEMTAIESFKGGISSALKRAGSAWGMGRYLYSLEAGFIPSNHIFEESQDGTYYGKTKTGKEFHWLPPKLPDWALPKKAQANQGNEPEGEAEVDLKPSKEELRKLFALSASMGFSTDDLRQTLKWTYQCESSTELTRKQYDELLKGIKGRYIKPQAKKVISSKK